MKIERLYDAPVKVVWEAWTDVKQVAKWWGPRGFRITTHSKDLKVGGQWIYTMHGPDGTDYPNITTYHLVEKYSKLVYDHGATPETPPLFRVEVEFSDFKGKTKMEMKMIFETVDIAVEMTKFIKSAGGNGTWDRLAEHLEKETTGNDKFFINRSFESPIDIVFDMWTNPEHLVKWLPPEGLTMSFFRDNISVGNSIFFKMSNGRDLDLFARAEYLEIQKPYRIKYKQQFCDENENISKHPFSPIWPESMLVTVDFVAEDSDQTRVTLICEAIGAVNEKELAAFLLERPGMKLGWTGSFDKLEESLV